MIRVKICCIADAEEMWAAVGQGAAAVGLVSAMPSGPGVIDEEEIDRLARLCPPGVASFLLTSRTHAGEIVAQQRRCGASVLQLCDRLEQGSTEDLRRALPGIRIVQVLHVEGEQTLAEARRAAQNADALLLDSGRPSQAVKELGGTGRVHDWSLSARIVESVSVPVYLAGGLKPENVAEAIRQVRPFGVDVCSGVRSAGRLDREKLARFMRAVAQA